MLMLILWALAPLALIPVTIILMDKNSKLKWFLGMLLKSGRISQSEYNNLTPDKDKETNDKPPEQPKEILNKEAPVVKPDINPAFNWEENNTPKAPAVNQVNTNIPAKTGNSSLVLFGIGIGFIILSGFIFSTAVWIYLSNIARVGILAAAALLFICISIFANKKFKLKNTSVAFYMLGTVFSAIAFITAGYFKLFRSWFSFSGDGICLLLSASAFIITAFFAAAIKIYKNNIYINFSLYFGLASVTLLLGQISTNAVKFPMLVSLLAAAVTALYYYFKNIKSIKIIKQIDNFIIVMRVIFGIISVSLVLWEILEWSICSWIICLLSIAECTYYGLKKDNKTMLSLQSIITAIAAIELAAKLSDYVNDNIVLLGLTAVLIALAFIYKFYKKIYTIFSDIVFMLSSFIVSAYLLFTNFIPYTFISDILIIDKPNIVYGIIAMSAVTAFIFITSLDSENILNKVCQIVLPVPLFIIAYAISHKYYLEYKTDILLVPALIVCSALFTAIAFAYKFYVKKDNRFVLTKYSFEAASGLVLMAAARNLEFFDLPFILVVLLSIAAFAEIHTSDLNGHSVLPIFSLFSAVSSLIIIEHFSNGFVIITSLIMCAVMTITSRLMFRESFRIQNGKKVHLDIPSVGIILSAFLVMKHGIGYSSSDMSYKLKIFIFLIEAAVFAANLYRKQHSKSFNLSAVTISAALFSLALIARPFWELENTIFANKIIFIIFIAFGFAFKTIWRSNKKLSSNVSSFIYMFTYILLLLDALANQTLFNTLLVLITSLTIMLAAFIIKKKTWFFLSAGGLAGLTIYMTKDFIKEIHWWVYLLCVGILLIIIASFNEYYKSKGESVKTKTKKFFDDWTW